MNCKQGDIAIVVRSESGREGYIVRCVEFVGMVGWIFNGEDRKYPTWRVDRELPTLIQQAHHKKWRNLAADFCLRPIRDPGEDARDEMLRPLPQDREVTA